MINPLLIDSCNIGTPRLISFSDVYFCRLCTSIILVFHDLFRCFEFVVASLPINWYLSSCLYMLVCFIDILSIYSSL